MFNQEPKLLIDVGEIGNASTGDILFDGGEKINKNFNAIYNAFGDQRKMDVNEGQGPTGQRIHATGYYQKAENNSVYSTPVLTGTCHDIDTSSGGFSVTLAKGVRGEGVFFINSNGSISVNNPLTIIAVDAFKGQAGPVLITSPFVKIECWCISDEGGRSIWDYSVTSMFGESQTPIDKTIAIPSTGSADIPLFHKTELNAAKLLVTSQTTDGKKIRSSEINILVDIVNNQVISTEYAIMRVGNINEEDDIAAASFNINGNDNVNLNITSDIIGLRVAVKVISTQKIGAVQ